MADILCAGHICLDVIPTLQGAFTFDPGKLLEVGAATVSTGGCVANTGLALNRLGADVALCGRLGDDAIGNLVLDVLLREGVRNPPKLTAGAQTSYTIVLNPPGQDRMFLHFPGANAEFSSEDVSDDSLRNARILHLGYPPLLRRLYLGGGEEVCKLFKRAHKFGVLTSLDMSFPDLAAESGHVNWKKWLRNVLPHCDVFVPSAPELEFMSSIPRDFDSAPIGALWSSFDWVTDLGARVVVVKLGEGGILSHAAATLEHPLLPRSWQNETHFEPAFKVEVAGTTGAGDAAVAGFLFALLQGVDLPEATRIAAAVGACSVERADALSGIPSWEGLQARLAKPWEKIE